MALSTQSLFTVQELTDYCIDFLHSSHGDLMACALVHRSWTETSQTHLFHHLSIIDPFTRSASSHLEAADSRWKHLCDVLATSARLRGFVRGLEIDMQGVSVENFNLIFSLSFPRIREVKILGTWTSSAILEAQTLLRLPTVTRVTLGGIFENLVTLAQVLESCSSHLHELSLFLVQITEVALADHPPITKQVAMKHLLLYNSSDAFRWLSSTQCPLVFTELKSLTLDTVSAQTLSQPPLSTLISKIEYLDLQKDPASDTPISLAEFTGLKHLEVAVALNAIDEVPWALGLLKTLPRSNRLEKIGFAVLESSFFDNDSWASYDKQILSSRTPHLKMVQVRFERETTPVLPDPSGTFPLLNALGLVRVCYF
ncbi:hypothetical protein FB45DRAFT_1006852 [Roridomyces roridus]|uniref:Uncharacterized protein n=1 Tax=Roridomyces roridus TaxID=1738132 RepID=A0AAD7BGU2_9AGAR|nr:hypothetical protein FB45DRAFT_1006852 [Roridomyces roridus]